MKKHYFIYLLASILFYGCANYNKIVSNNNVANIYNPSSSQLHPNHSIYNNSDTESILYTIINTNELLFRKNHIDDPEIGKVSITYSLYSSFENSELIDSVTTLFNIEKPQTSHDFIANIPLKTNGNIKYFLKVTTQDLERKNKDIQFLTIDKTSNKTEQNFLVVDQYTNKPYFQNYLNKYSVFTIKNQRVNSDKIFIKFYKKRYPLAAPPYSMAPFKTQNLVVDTIWEYNLSDTTSFNLPYYGMYHFQTDTSSKEGLTLYNFDENYPVVNTPEKLLEPLRFITSKKEYDKYMLYVDKKQAIDKFWLKSSGNMDRARELIRIYYNRVLFANVYFTSYTEGWKTDRGMIYTIYGPPGTIYKTDNSETWQYGDTSNMLSITFTFSKTENPYSNNDFILQRKELFKQSWYQAVDTWRNGRVFSIANY